MAVVPGGGAGSPPVAAPSASATARGGVSLLLARCTSLALASGVAILLARHLGPTGFGDLTVILSVNVLLLVLADFGLPVLASREWPALGAGERGGWLSAFLRTRLVASGVVTVVSAAVVVALPLHGALRGGLVVICLGLAPTSYVTATGYLLNASFSSARAAQVELVARLLWTALLLVAVTTGAGVVGICLAMTAGQYAGAAWARLVVGRSFRRDRAPAGLGRSLVRSALPLASLPLLGILYARADTVILAGLIPRSDLGVYGVLYRVLDVFLNLTAIFSAMLTPLLVRAGTQAEQRRLVLRAQRYLLAGLLPAAALAAAAVRPLLTLIGGESFRAVADTGPSLQLAMAALMGAFSLGLVTIVNSSVLLARRQQGRLLRLYCVMIPLNAGLTVLLATRLSYLGAAYAVLISEALTAAYSSVLMRRALGGSDLRAGLLPPVAVTAAGVLAFLAAAPLEGVVRWGVTAAVFLAAIVVSPERTDLARLLAAVLGRTSVGPAILEQRDAVTSGAPER